MNDYIVIKVSELAAENNTVQETLTSVAALMAAAEMIEEDPELLKLSQIPIDVVQIYLMENIPNIDVDKFGDLYMYDEVIFDFGA